MKLLGLLLLASQPFASRPIVDPPNVCIVIMDDVGWTEWPTMTSLADLAEEGTLFTRFIVQPMCSPTRVGMLSGMYPRRLGIGSVIDTFDYEASASPAPNRLAVMLPEVLRRTHQTALIGKAHFGLAAVENGTPLFDDVWSGPFAAGFEHFLAGAPSNLQHGAGAAGFYDWVRCENQSVTFDESTYATDMQLDAFTDWWANTAGPKFCVLSFSDAHAPYDTPPGMASGGTTRQKFIRKCEYLNGALAAVRSTINLANTHLLVFGDNGTASLARLPGTPAGVWKGSTYGNYGEDVSPYYGFGGGICTPMVWAGPGVAVDVSSDRIVAAMDIPATLFEILGTSSRGFTDSVSFADELGSWTGAAAREWIMAEHYDCQDTGAQPLVVGYDDVAILEDEWKMRTWDADGVGAGAAITRFYYLTSDPTEQTPLTEAQADAIDSAAVDRLQGHAAALPARL